MNSPFLDVDEGYSKAYLSPATPGTKEAEIENLVKMSEESYLFQYHLCHPHPDYHFLAVDLGQCPSPSQKKPALASPHKTVSEGLVSRGNHFAVDSRHVSCCIK